MLSDFGGFLAQPREEFYGSRKRRLHLRGRAVDLVGEQEVAEHRAELGLERPLVGPVDARADEVGGHEVGRELHAAERAADHVERVPELVDVAPEPREAALEALARRGGFDSWIDCVRGIAPVTSAFYVHTFESLARRHRMLIAAGTIHLPGEYRAAGPAPVFNAAFVFGQGGEVCGEQRQTRPSPGDALGLAHGDAVSAFATAPARIGILIKSDFFERDLRAELLAQGA